MLHGDGADLNGNLSKHRGDRGGRQNSPWLQAQCILSVTGSYRHSYRHSAGTVQVTGLPPSLKPPHPWIFSNSKEGRERGQRGVSGTPPSLFPRTSAFHSNLRTGVILGGTLFVLTNCAQVTTPWEGVKISNFTKQHISINKFQTHIGHATNPPPVFSDCALLPFLFLSIFSIFRVLPTLQVIFTFFATSVVCGWMGGVYGFPPKASTVFFNNF